MSWFIWIGGAIILIIVILVTLMIRIELHYCHRGGNDALQVTVATLAGFVRLKRQFPVVKMDPDKPIVHRSEKHIPSSAAKQGKRKKRIILNKLQQTPQNLPHWKNRIADLLRILKSFLTSVYCVELTWRSTIGTGDAAETGTLIGLIWGIKAPLLGWGIRYINMQTVPQLDLTPDFHRPRLETDFHCILKFRLGHAILVGIRLLHLFLHLKKTFFKKERRFARQSEPVT